MWKASPSRLLSNLNPPSCEAARGGFVLIIGKGKWPMIAGHRVNRDDSRPQDTAWEQEQAPVSRAKHRNPEAAERGQNMKAYETNRSVVAEVRADQEIQRVGGLRELREDEIVYF